MAKQPSENDLRPINVSTRELSTQQQLHSLMQVAGMMWSVVHGPPQNPFDDAPLKPQTGEGVIAAENCFIKTCAAIEKIVDDHQRWGFDFQKQLEEDYSAAMKMNLEYIRAQRDAAIEATSPHHVCNPALVRLADGNYAAVLGNPNDPLNSLTGVGRSPQEALEAFDEVFRGTVTKIKNEQQQQNQSVVDTSAIEATPEPPKRRRIYPRNKPQDGQKPESGGAGNL
jgi:hypothetical protein